MRSLANDFTLSAGAVVVRYENAQPLFLLLRAYHYWDFPKGRVESGESALDAARREIREESGITDLNFRFGYQYCDTEPYGKNKVARFFVAETRTRRVVMGINPILRRPEHHEYRWCTVEEAMSLLHPRLQRVLNWARFDAGWMQEQGSHAA